MRRWELIESTRAPEGGELRLYRHGDDWSIVLPGAGELMGTRSRGSEEELARLGCAAIAQRARPRVLVGGLGLGFTLAAALRVLPEAAEVVVAELVAAVVAWNRGAPGAAAGHPLSDPRVRVHAGDVAAALAAEAGAFDAILLDVDNGPQGLTRAANDGLYSARGLARARRALRPGGVLALWSAQEDEGFTVRLATAGFVVELAHARGHQGRGGRYVIWVATAA